MIQKKIGTVRGHISWDGIYGFFFWASCGCPTRLSWGFWMEQLRSQQRSILLIPGDSWITSDWMVKPMGPWAQQLRSMHDPNDSLDQKSRLFLLMGWEWHHHQPAQHFQIFQHEVYAANKHAKADVTKFPFTKLSSSWQRSFRNARKDAEQKKTSRQKIGDDWFTNFYLFWKYYNHS